MEYASAVYNGAVYASPLYGLLPQSIAHLLVVHPQMWVFAKGLRGEFCPAILWGIGGVWAGKTS
jgi:hypothetical protein